MLFDWDEYAPIDIDSGIRKLNDEGDEAVRVELRKLHKIADRLSMPVSKAVLERSLAWPDSTPQTLKEFEKIAAIFQDEIGKRKCLFIPAHVEPLFERDEIVPDEVVTAFPTAFPEIRNAGTSLSVGLYTASVFHAMRAVEIGLRAMNGTFPIVIKGNKPLALAEWKDILDGLAKVALDIENRPNIDQTKEPDSYFLSEASAQFRFFKNGWRVRVAHARATYDEAQAGEVLVHVISFFKFLATRLSE